MANPYGGLEQMQYGSDDVMNELQGAGWQRDRSQQQGTAGGYDFRGRPLPRAPPPGREYLPMDGYPHYPARFGPDADGRTLGQPMYGAGFQGQPLPYGDTMPPPHLEVPAGQGVTEQAPVPGQDGTDAPDADPGQRSFENFWKGQEAYDESHPYIALEEYQRASQAWKDAGKIAVQPGMQSIYDGAVDIRYKEKHLVGERLLELRRERRSCLKEKFVFEKLIEVPQVIIKESTREVSKPELVERIIEVPKTEVVEKVVTGPPRGVDIHERIIEEPKTVIEERVIHVPKREVQERLIEVPKVEFVERILYEDYVEYREVPVDKIVEVPEIEYQIRQVEEVVPQDYIFEYFQDVYKEQPVHQTQEVERVEYVPILLPPNYDGPVMPLNEFQRMYYEQQGYEGYGQQQEEDPYAAGYAAAWAEIAAAKAAQGFGYSGYPEQQSEAPTMMPQEPIGREPTPPLSMFGGEATPPMPYPAPVPREPTLEEKVLTESTFGVKSAAAMPTPVQSEGAVPPVGSLPGPPGYAPPPASTQFNYESYQKSQAAQAAQTAKAYTTYEASQVRETSRSASINPSQVGQMAVGTQFLVRKGSIPPSGMPSPPMTPRQTTGELPSMVATPPGDRGPPTEVPTFVPSPSTLVPNTGYANAFASGAGFAPGR